MNATPKADRCDSGGPNRHERVFCCHLLPPCCHLQNGVATECFQRCCHCCHLFREIKPLERRGANIRTGGNGGSGGNKFFVEKATLGIGWVLYGRSVTW